MMYPRLKLAKNLLTEDGVMFISIDDNEVENLKKICGEIFGESNIVGTFLKQSKVGGGSDSKFIVKEHEFCLILAKNIEKLEDMYIEHDENYLKRYKFEDEYGKYFWDTFARPGLSISKNDTMFYDIKAPDGTIISNRWIHSKERFKDDLEKGFVRFIKKDNNNWSVQFKQYLNNKGKKPRSMTMDFGGTIEGKKQIKELFNNDRIFPYPKSVVFIKKLVNIINSSDFLVLDFFSGSATSAHSIMKLNSEDNGNRKFIMIQIPEGTDENSEAYKAGYKNICEIGKERIRRAGDKILEESDNKDLDIGFKVFKLDSSNLEKWDPDYNNLEQILLTAKDNIKFYRTQEDLIYEIMLKYGVDLALPIKKHEITGNTIYSIGFGALLICLDDNITKEICDKIIKLGSEGTRVVFKDNGFKSDSEKTNIKEILKTNNIEEFITI